MFIFYVYDLGVCRYIVLFRIRIYCSLPVLMSGFRRAQTFLEYGKGTYMQNREGKVT